MSNRDDFMGFVHESVDRRLVNREEVATWMGTVEELDLKDLSEFARDAEQVFADRKTAELGQVVETVSFLYVSAGGESIASPESDMAYVLKPIVASLAPGTVLTVSVKADAYRLRG